MRKKRSFYFAFSTYTLKREKGNIRSSIREQKYPFERERYEEYEETKSFRIYILHIQYSVISLIGIPAEKKAPQSVLCISMRPMFSILENKKNYLSG